MKPLFAVLHAAGVRRLVVVGALLLAILVVTLAVRGGSVRPPSPPSTAPGSPTESGALATAATVGRVTPPTGAMSPQAARTTTTGQVIVQGAWGGGPGQFGRRRDPESNPEAPMAVAAGPGGQLAVVDQVNRRILRYKNGKLTGSIDLGGDTVQDLTLTKDGRLLVLDRLADANVQSYGPDGKLLDTLSLTGKGVPEGGGVTGLFADDDGIYVERDHESVVRIADASGRADPARPELLGRPSRDGRLLLAAAIVDRALGEIVVRAVDRATGQPAWEQPLRLGAPIVHIVALDSDRRGMIYLAVDVGREAPTPPYPLVDEKLVLARLGGGGVPRGVLEVPPLPAADETFRPVTVDDDGTVFVMAGGDNGLTVTRYVFP